MSKLGSCERSAQPSHLGGTTYLSINQKAPLETKS